MLQNNKLKKNSIHIYPVKQNVRMAMSFAEDSATAWGMEKREALSLVLATEKIFLYICNSGKLGQDVEILSIDGGYFLQVEFVFSRAEINLRAFNITYQPAYESEQDMNDVGLLLASRHVDRLRLTGEANNRLRLVLIKEKKYPLPDKAPEWLPARGTKFRVRSADPVEAERFAWMTQNHFKSNQLPPFLEHPGKLSDMLAGNYACALAEDAEGHQAGGILWRWDGATAECYGPYLFTPGLFTPGENNLDDELL